MIQKIKERIFPSLIALSALSVSVSAAYYSVTGLSMLFAGASFAVMILASCLEISKLVIVSLLYQYRKTLPKLLKIYLTTSAIILILITSAGIYGFLSSSYQVTSNKSSLINSKVKLLETKKISFEKIKGQYEIEKQSLIENISSLRNALGSNTQSYIDKKGNVINYSSSSNRKAYEKQLEIAIQKDEQLTKKIQTYNDSIINFETQIVETQSNTELAAELGPLKYLSNLTGVGMDKIINWFILVIIFVFDPLAIALVIAANFAFEQVKNKYKQHQYITDVMKGDQKDGLYDNDIELETASLNDLNKWENEEINDIKNSLDILEDINQNTNHEFKWKKDKVNEEITKLKNKLFNNDDENTIRYF